MGLGSYPAVTLAEAREKAADARKLTRQGVDPIDSRRASGEATRGLTFDQACEAYVKAQADGWRNPKTAKRWSATCAQ